MKFFKRTFGRMKKNFIREREGNAGDILATSICLLTLLVVLITTVHYVKIMELKRIINNYAREYVLILEENGELTSTEVQELKSKITSLGFSHVDIAYNDTNTKVDYGKQVSLYVGVTASYQELGLSKVYSYIKDTYDVSIKLFSTSKT